MGLDRYLGVQDVDQEWDSEVTWDTSSNIGIEIPVPPERFKSWAEKGLLVAGPWDGVWYFKEY